MGNVAIFLGIYVCGAAWGCPVTDALQLGKKRPDQEPKAQDTWASEVPELDEENFQGLQT